MFSLLALLFPWSGGAPQDTKLEDLDHKHFAKGVIPPKRGNQTAASAAEAARAQAREIALTEAKIQRLCELVQEVRGCSPEYSHGLTVAMHCHVTTGAAVSQPCGSVLSLCGR